MRFGFVPRENQTEEGIRARKEAEKLTELNKMPSAVCRGGRTLKPPSICWTAIKRTFIQPRLGTVMVESCWGRQVVEAIKPQQL